MATLQRSTKSYRRDGSSGAIWDGKFLAEMDENEKREFIELRHCHSVHSVESGSRTKQESTSSPTSGAAATENPVFVRSSSVPGSTLKWLFPKSVGQKFKGVRGKPPSFLKPNHENHD